MDHCLSSPGEWVLRVFLVPGVAYSLSHTSPHCLSSPLAFVMPYFVWCCFVFHDVSPFSHKKKFLFLKRHGSFFFLFLCTLFVTGEECWVELSQPVHGCPSHGTKCKDHHINHQTCKNKQRQKQPSDNEADYSRNLHPYTPRPLHIWPSRRNLLLHM